MKRRYFCNAAHKITARHQRVLLYCSSQTMSRKRLTMREGRHRGGSPCQGPVSPRGMNGDSPRKISEDRRGATRDHPHPPPTVWETDLDGSTDNDSDLDLSRLRIDNDNNDNNNVNSPPCARSCLLYGTLSRDQSITVPCLSPGSHVNNTRDQQGTPASDPGRPPRDNSPRDTAVTTTTHLHQRLYIVQSPEHTDTASQSYMEHHTCHMDYLLSKLRHEVVSHNIFFFSTWFYTCTRSTFQLPQKS